MGRPRPTSKPTSKPTTRPWPSRIVNTWSDWSDPSVMPEPIWSSWSPSSDTWSSWSSTVDDWSPWSSTTTKRYQTTTNRPTTTAEPWWSEWAACTATCGQGKQSRRQMPNGGIESRVCYVDPCPATESIY